MPGLRRINQTKVDPRTRRGLAMLAQDAQLLFGDGLETVAITGISGGGVTMTLALADPSGLVKSGGLAVDPKASGGLAIDTDGVYIVLDTPAHGQHLSLSSTGLSIDDDYVFNTGDSMTGALDITDTATQFTLKYDVSNTVTFTVGSSGDLTVAASGGDVFFSDENVTTTGSGTFGSMTISDLTATRVPYASTNGLLVDSISLSFQNSSLVVGDNTYLGGANSLTAGYHNTVNSNFAFTFGDNLTNNTNNSFMVGFAAVDLVITSGSADFQDTDIVTTGTLDAGITTVTTLAGTNFSIDVGGSAEADFTGLDAIKIGTLTLESNTITDSTGTISFSNENLTNTGYVQTSELVIPLTAATWKFGEDLVANFFAIENDTSGYHSIIRQYAKDGDGTDYVVYEIVGYGTRDSLTNYHIGLFGWNIGGWYGFYTIAGGSQTDKQVRMYVGSDDDQLVIATNGRIGIQDTAPAQTLDVNGTINAISGYYSNDLQGWSGTFTNGDGNTVTVTGGIITDVGP